jgi:hypothetical protein
MIFCCEEVEAFFSSACCAFLVVLHNLSAKFICDREWAPNSLFTLTSHLELNVFLLGKFARYLRISCSPVKVLLFDGIERRPKFS